MTSSKHNTDLDQPIVYDHAAIKAWQDAHGWTRVPELDRAATVERINPAIPAAGCPDGSDQQEEGTDMTKRQPITWTYEPINHDELRALDLQAEAAKIDEPIACYRIHRNDSPTSAEAVFIEGAGRVGIAWGATADWADYADIEQAIEDWVNNPDEFEARN